MRHPDIEAFARAAPGVIGPGPAALVFLDDAVAVAATVAHLRAAGFGTVAVFGPADYRLPVATEAHYVAWDGLAETALPDAVNRVIAACPGAWLHYCYNAEFLFFPFSETRRVAELTAFHAEEKREAMPTFVIDLYPADRAAVPDGVCLKTAHLDKTGYYALARTGSEGALDRQLDFFGGLRWRFEEHVPEDRRRIDRIGLFRARPGLRLRADHTFDDPEYNTYACRWHNNLTAAVCSFRAAKALCTNPGSREAVRSFLWPGSVPFDWRAQQLLDLGFIEPGQWF